MKFPQSRFSFAFYSSHSTPSLLELVVPYCTFCLLETICPIVPGGSQQSFAGPGWALPFQDCTAANHSVSISWAMGGLIPGHGCKSSLLQSLVSSLSHPYKATLCTSTAKGRRDDSICGQEGCVWTTVKAQSMWRATNQCYTPYM